MKIIIKHLPGKHSQKKHGKGGEVQMTQELEEYENLMWSAMPQVLGSEILVDMQPLRDWKRFPGKALEDAIYHSSKVPGVDAIVNEKTGVLAGLAGEFNNYNPDRGQKPVVAMERMGAASYFDGSTEAVKFLLEQAKG